MRDVFFGSGCRVLWVLYLYIYMALVLGIAEAFFSVSESIARAKIRYSFPTESFHECRALCL